MTAQIQAEALLLAINLKDPRIIFTLADRTIVAAKLCRLLDRIAKLEALQAAPPAPAAVPVLYVSPAQLEKHLDLEGAENAEAGRYLPARKTPAGKFTQPLCALAAAPAQAVAVPAPTEALTDEPVTKQMIDAGAKAAREYMARTGGNNLTVIYRAMRAVAPAGGVSASPAQEHAAQLAGQGQKKCVCTFAQRVVGDGCRQCNPQEYIDRLHKCLDEYREEADAPAQAQEDARNLEAEALRACRDLPEDWEIAIHLEKGYGGVVLIDPEGNENDLPVDGTLFDALKESIGQAIQADAARAAQGGAKP